MWPHLYKDDLKCEFPFGLIIGLNTPFSHSSRTISPATCCFFPEERESPLSVERARLREKYDGNFLGPKWMTGGTWLPAGHSAVGHVGFFLDALPPCTGSRMAHDPSSRGWELRLEWLDRRQENGKRKLVFPGSWDAPERRGRGQCKIIDQIYIEFLKLTVSTIFDDGFFK